MEDNQHILDRMLRHRIYLLGFGKYLADKVIAILNSTAPAIRRMLLDLFGITSRGRGGVIGKMREAEVEIRKIRSEAWDQGFELVLAELISMAKSEPQEFRKATGVDLKGLTSAKIAALVASTLVAGHTLQEWFTIMSQADVRRAVAQIRISVLAGEPIAKLFSRLVGKLSTVAVVANNGVKGLLATVVGAVSDAVRRKVLSANPDTFHYEQWVSILDNRTTPQCFPGSVTVLPLGKVEKVFKRFYEGEMIVITTALGKQLRLTPNHPVLTSDGWTAAKEVQPGKHVLHSVPAESLAVQIDENICVPPTMSCLADAFFQPSRSTILVNSPTKTQFHGDGIPGEQKVYVACAKGSLRDYVNVSGRQAVEDELFSDCHGSRLLLSLRCLQFHFLGGVLRQQSSKLGASAAQHCVQPTFAARPTEQGINITGTLSGAECRDGGFSVGQDIRIPDSAWQMWHDSQLLKQTCDRSRSSVEVSSNLTGALPIAITKQDVVNVRSEFFRGHVYNLSTSTGVYIADSFIVHNCRSLDGQVFSIAEGPMPGYHFWCRSIRIPFHEDGGPHVANSYAEWVDSQPETFQKYAGTVFRAMDLAPLTLAQVHRLDQTE
jgi:hypothetical protein